MINCELFAPVQIKMNEKDKEIQELKSSLEEESMQSEKLKEELRQHKVHVFYF